MNLWPWSKKTQTTGLTPEDVLREFLRGAESATGIPVNHTTALQASTALACARVIAEGLAQVPLKLLRKLPEGGSEAAVDRPGYDVVHSKPNSYQSSYDWREQAGLHLVFAGNHYAFINRTQFGIQEILPYEPSSVSVTKVNHELRYEVLLADGRWMKVPAADMLHLKGPSWNGFEGLDGVKLAREAIGLGMATEKHGAKLFANGATPGGVLSSDQVTMTREQKDLLRESWESTHGGANNAYKTAVLWGGMKWDSTAQHNDQAQFLQTRAFQVEEVCRAFRVMPIMVGHADKAATYASAEQMFLAHVVHTMGPWYSRLEQAYDTQLLTDKERTVEGLYFNHVVSGLMRGSHKDRADYYSKMYTIGALSPNEIRAREEMNPYDGGDEYRVPMNAETPGTGEPDQPDEASEEDDDES